MLATLSNCFTAESSLLRSLTFIIFISLKPTCNPQVSGLYVEAVGGAYECSAVNVAANVRHLPWSCNLRAAGNTRPVQWLEERREKPCLKKGHKSMTYSLTYTRKTDNSFISVRKFVHSNIPDLLPEMSLFCFFSSYLIVDTPTGHRYHTVQKDKNTSKLNLQQFMLSVASYLPVDTRSHL